MLLFFKAQSFQRIIIGRNFSSDQLGFFDSILRLFLFPCTQITIVEEDRMVAKAFGTLALCLCLNVAVSLLHVSGQATGDHDSKKEKESNTDSDSGDRSNIVQNVPLERGQAAVGVDFLASLIRIHVYGTLSTSLRDLALATAIRNRAKIGVSPVLVVVNSAAGEIMLNQAPSLGHSLIALLVVVSHAVLHSVLDQFPSIILEENKYVNDKDVIDTIDNTLKT